MTEIEWVMGRGMILLEKMIRGVFCPAIYNIDKKMCKVFSVLVCFFFSITAYFEKNRALNFSSCSTGKLFIPRLRLKNIAIYSSVVSLSAVRNSF